LIGHHQCIEVLLDRNANINACNDNSETPLHHASRSGQHQCIEVLIDHGADKSIKPSSTTKAAGMSGMR